MVNGEEVLDSPAVLENNRTMVPLRFVSEALGAQVVWQQNENAVYINDQPEPWAVTNGDQVDKDTFLLYNRGQLEALKINLSQGETGKLRLPAENLFKSAEAARKLIPPSVVQKAIAPSGGDLHDYLSLATYFWPDPTKPDGLPYISHDGQVNPERNSPDRYDAARMGKMVSSVETLSLAYYLTGKEAYATKAAEVLRTWFINPDLS